MFLALGYLITGLLIYIFMFVVVMIGTAYKWLGSTWLASNDVGPIRLASNDARGAGTEFMGGKDIDKAPPMSTLLKAFTRFMSPALKTIFTDLFVARYSSLNNPPVITVDDIPRALPYEGGTRVYRPATHIGQRKLFLSELQFFTDHIPIGPISSDAAADDSDAPGDNISDDVAVSSIICVYAGAAPSNHTGYLAKLFPQVKFILVDPNPFDIYEAKPIVLHQHGDAPITDKRAEELVRAAVAGTSQIYIINDLFTLEISRAAHKLIPHAQLYFISDIRTNVNENGGSPDAIDILWNLSQQYNWMQIMKPAWSMLKFRHPFYNEAADVFASKSKMAPYHDDFELSARNGIDFIKNFETHTLTYWDGTANLQAFPGRASTETRLVTNGTTIRDWGTPTDYDNKLFYYNLIERMYCHHANANAAYDLGFDHCNDCAIENVLWTSYIAKYPDTAALFSGKVRDLVKKLSDITRRPLVRESHGRFFDKLYPLPKLIAAAQMKATDPDIDSVDMFALIK